MNPVSEIKVGELYVARKKDKGRNIKEAMSQIKCWAALYVAPSCCSTYYTEYLTPTSIIMCLEEEMADWLHVLDIKTMRVGWVVKNSIWYENLINLKELPLEGKQSQ